MKGDAAAAASDRASDKRFSLWVFSRARRVDAASTSRQQRTRMLSLLPLDFFSAARHSRHEFMPTFVGVDLLERERESGSGTIGFF